MNDNLSVAELDDRIAILRDNLRQLVEQAAAASGSQNEERIADRITQQTEELDRLILERDSRARARLPRGVSFARMA
jgi:predicted RNA-binding protein